MSPVLVIFDLDGVLVDSELLSAQALAELLSAEGVAMTAAEVVARFTGLTDAEIGQRVARETGRAMPADFARQAELRSLALFDGALAAMPGAAALLEGLALPFCVASNSAPERIARSLAAAGLAPHFTPETLFSSALVARPKPAPDIYLHAARAMGAAPADCLVVEDSPTGVRAAAAAGMTVLGFTGAGHVSDSGALGAALREAGAGDLLERLTDLLDSSV